MCGIVTLVTPPGREVSTQLLRQLTTILRHRGPDDEGYAWVDPNSGKFLTWDSRSACDAHFSGVLFGHRRLSILDLSAAGHQPLLNNDGLLILSYNGEIYNFAELRSELEAYGVEFRGRSDTEVLLRAYERWEEAALDRLNGMWAFTLWDGRRKRLVVSRDRFGVKPLYYTEVDGTWIFASEIKAILAYPGAHRGVRQAKIFDFLVHGPIDHPEETLFAHVSSVPPGSCLHFIAGRLIQRKFWSLEGGRHLSDSTEAELIERFRDILVDSVRIRMRSDVPVGTMLSSGLDSSSIAACVQALGKKAATAGPCIANSGDFSTFHQAFTACWPRWSKNEEAQVESLANTFGLSLHKYYPSGEETCALLSQVAYALDEPFESPIPIVQYVLMGMAKAKGVSVVLNGHGADEVLAGYPGMFAPPFLVDLLLSGRFTRFIKEERGFRATGELRIAGLVAALARRFIPVWLLPCAIRLRRQYSRHRTTIFSTSIEDTARSHPLAYACPRDLSPLSRSLWLSFSQQVLPQWLRMEDRTSMSQSVESRLPFLDYRLVEFAFALPDEMKLRDGFTKYVLRKAMANELPGWLTSQRRKTRFSAPYASWFRGPWRPLIEDFFLAGSFQCQPFLDVKCFRANLERDLTAGTRNVSPQVLWRILNTEAWLRVFRQR
jgi:asparagine synthase (glutamine-hydrolysing)